MKYELKLSQQWEYIYGWNILLIYWNMFSSNGTQSIEIEYKVKMEIYKNQHNMQMIMDNHRTATTNRNDKVYS